MSISKKGIVFGVSLVVVFFGILAFLIMRWDSAQNKKFERGMVKLRKSVSLPGTADFKDYVVVVGDQMKKSFTIYDVHKIMRGYSKIETVSDGNGYVEYYRYDFLEFPLMIVRPGVTIEYDSNWNYKRFISDT